VGVRSPLERWIGGGGKKRSIGVVARGTNRGRRVAGGGDGSRRRRGGIVGGPDLSRKRQLAGIGTLREGRTKGLRVQLRKRGEEGV